MTRESTVLTTALSAGLLSLALVTSAGAAKLAGVEIEESIDTAAGTLALQGTGLRKRLFVKIYAAGLYLPEGSPVQPSWLVDADEPIAITLDIVSDLATRDKMVEALNEGFATVTGGNTASIADGMAALEEAMGDAMKSGSSMSFEYEPGVGTHVSRDGEEKAVIEGLEFKQALFGIWLSDKPVSGKLKSSLLGG